MLYVIILLWFAMIGVILSCKRIKDKAEIILFIAFIALIILAGLITSSMTVSVDVGQQLPEFTNKG